MCAWSENLRRVVRWSSRCESRGVLLPLFRDRILLGGISNIISTAFADARKMGVGETLVSKSIYKCLMWIGQFFGSQGAIACGRLPPLDWSQRRCWRQYQTRSLWWCHRWGSYKTLKPCSSRDSCSNIERTHITYEIIKIYCSKMIRPDKMYIRYTLTALKNSGGYQLSYISSHSGMELIQDPRTKMDLCEVARIAEPRAPVLQRAFSAWLGVNASSAASKFPCSNQYEDTGCFYECSVGEGCQISIWYPNSTYPWSLRSF